VNWDSFLLQTKDTIMPSRREDKETTAESERERAGAKVGWDSFLSETKSQKPPMPSGGSGSQLVNWPNIPVASKKSATTREESPIPGVVTLRRDERRNVGLWNSQKSVGDDVEAIGGSDSKAKDWQTAAQVDNTFLLDLAHECCT
jgi:hypothetical protein